MMKLADTMQSERSESQTLQDSTSMRSLKESDSEAENKTAPEGLDGGGNGELFGWYKGSVVQDEFLPEVCSIVSNTALHS